MKYINKPGLATSEGAEHTFGIIRTIIREFTPIECVLLAEKKTFCINLLFCNGFGTYRDTQKGYDSTFTDFIELSCDESMPVMDGSVEIHQNGSTVVEQLWVAVDEVMSYTS